MADQSRLWLAPGRVVENSKFETPSRPVRRFVKGLLADSRSQSRHELQPGRLRYKNDLGGWECAAFLSVNICVHLCHLWTIWVGGGL